MQAFLRSAPTTLSIVATCALLALPVRAHDDAQWIMDDYRYVDWLGAHCCGPTDCRREKAVNFREAREGIYFSIGAGHEVLMHRSLIGRGLYISKDRDWWLCIRDGKPRCIFKPATEG